MGPAGQPQPGAFTGDYQVLICQVGGFWQCFDIAQMASLVQKGSTAGNHGRVSALLFQEYGRVLACLANPGYTSIDFGIGVLFSG
jgi:hypothetical protein